MTANDIRDVPGFSGYKVDTEGNIYGLKGAKLSVELNDRGYARIKSSHGKWLIVHKAVLEAFVGPRKPNEVCRHLNGNKLDNRLENLSWGTRRQNWQDYTAHIGVDKPVFKPTFTDEQVRYIRSCDVGAGKLARQYNTTPWTVSRCRKRMSYKHIE